jgi:hypothetical protein
MTRRRSRSQKTDAHREVTACLAAIWPMLLEASDALDRRRPRAAAPHLEAAAARLLESASRLGPERRRRGAC